VCEDHVRLFVRPSVTWCYRLNRLSQSSNSVWQCLSHRETSSRASFVKIGSEIVRLPLKASVDFCACLKHKLSSLHEIQYNRSAQNAVGHLSSVTIGGGKADPFLLSRNYSCVCARAQ